MTLACGDGGGSADDDGDSGDSSSGDVDDGSASSPTGSPTSSPTGSPTSAEDDSSDDTDASEDDADASTDAGDTSEDTGTSGGATTVDVAGTVTGWIGHPIAGAEVTIAGTTVITDDDGAFAITDVETPYDARVVDEGSVTVLVGLTRADPSLHTYGGFTDYHTAQIDGEFSGGAGFPNPDGHGFAVAFDGFDTHTESWSYSIGDGPDYHLQPQWYGPAAQEGTVMALQWESVVNGQPLGYDALGVLDIAISDGGLFLDQDFELAPVGDSIVVGALMEPDGAIFSEVRLFVGTGESASVFVGWQEDAVDSYEFLVPQGQGAYASVSYISGTNDAYVFAYLSDVAPGTMDADLEIPALPAWTAPLDGGTDFGLDTPLAWTGIADAVSVVLVGCIDADVDVHIVTAESGVAIPDLSDLGVQFPALAACYVVLDQYAPYASVDAWSGPESPMRNRSRVDSSYPATALSDGAYAAVQNLEFTASP